MSTTQIEHNIPLPVRNKRYEEKYPWGSDELNVNDSFVVKLTLGSARVNAIRKGKKHNRKFYVKELTNKTCRVWRTA